MWERLEKRNSKGTSKIKTIAIIGYETVSNFDIEKDWVLDSGARHGINSIKDVQWSRNIIIKCVNDTRQLLELLDRMILAERMNKQF
ncbi:hypothetical protein CR513_23162, partial [Mucuna pruriens]